MAIKAQFDYHFMPNEVGHGRPITAFAKSWAEDFPPMQGCHVNRPSRRNAWPHGHKLPPLLFFSLTNPQSCLPLPCINFFFLYHQLFPSLPASYPLNSWSVQAELSLQQGSPLPHLLSPSSSSHADTSCSFKPPTCTITHHHSSMLATNMSHRQVSSFCTVLAERRVVEA